MKTASILLASLLGTLSIGAVAQQDGGITGGATQAGGERNTQTFTELDLDNDGVLSQEEVQQSNLGADMEELDQDGDGEVNRNEYFQYHRDQ